MKKAVIIFIMITFSPAFLFCAVTGPMDALKGPIDEGISLLRDPKFKNPSLKNVQRDKIWEIAGKAFDFMELSGRALAGNWKRFSPQQRIKFSKVFSEILGNTYYEKVRGEYRDEKVVYIGEEMVTDSKAVVKTKIVREKSEFSVDYNMRLKDNNWKVYDVQIEGISLVQNYRSQFNEILSKESPDELIGRLEKKLAEQQKVETK